MEIKYISGGKASPKARDHNPRQFKARNYSQRSNLFEAIAIAKANGGDVVSRREEDGVVRMKIAVRKQDLKQMLQVIAGNGNCKKSLSPNHHQVMSSSSSSSCSSSSSSSLPSLSLEQRLGFLRKKQLSRANSGRQSRRGSWSPVLQSIPEEF